MEIKLRKQGLCWTAEVYRDGERCLFGQSHENIELAIEEAKRFIVSDLKREISLYSHGTYFNKGDKNPILDIREEGELKRKSFYLSEQYDWSLIKDNEDMLVLVPNRKEITF